MAAAQTPSERAIPPAGPGHDAAPGAGAPDSASRRRRSLIARAAVLALRAVIVLAVLHVVGVLRPDRHAITGIVVVLAVLAVVWVPSLVRMAQSLSFERAARIREHERAEVAAHLHDSVLQTLALIQTRAGEAREVAALARRQERELRRWLFERPGDGAGDSVKSALERAAAEIEERHRVPIEAVVVGDRPLDAQLEALVQAAREALTNAAKFAGSDHVDLFAEVDVERVEVFVRDRGAGFDPSTIPPDRRGIRDSIVGRLERHGGRATVRSAPAEGTEVELAVALAGPRAKAAT